MSVHRFYTVTVGGKRHAKCRNCGRGFHWLQLFVPPCDRPDAD